MEPSKNKVVEFAKNTPYEYIQAYKEYKNNNFHNKICNSLDEMKTAVKNKKIFIFEGEIRDSDYSSLKLGKIFLLLIFSLLVLLFIFGDFRDPYFLIFGLMPLFSMGVIAFGYYKNGKDNINGKPTWFLIIGPKGMVFNVKNMEKPVFIEWFDMNKLTARMKKKKKINIDTLGINFIYRNIIEFSIDFFHFGLKDLGEKGRENLLELIKLYKEAYSAY